MLGDLSHPKSHATGGRHIDFQQAGLAIFNIMSTWQAA